MQRADGTSQSCMANARVHKSGSRLAERQRVASHLEETVTEEEVADIATVVHAQHPGVLCLLRGVHGHVQAEPLGQTWPLTELGATRDPRDGDRVRGALADCRGVR